jgi:hypothetical protein
VSLSFSKALKLRPQIRGENDNIRVHVNRDRRLTALPRTRPNKRKGEDSRCGLHKPFLVRDNWRAGDQPEVHLPILECAFHIRKGPMECSQGLRLDVPSIGVYIRVRGASRFDGNLYLVNLSFLSTI